MSTASELEAILTPIQRSIQHWQWQQRHEAVYLVCGFVGSYPVHVGLWISRKRIEEQIWTILKGQHPLQSENHYKNVNIQKHIHSTYLPTRKSAVYLVSSKNNIIHMNYKKSQVNFWIICRYKCSRTNENNTYI